MKKTFMMWVSFLLTIGVFSTALAEARRDGDDQRAAKTQYMLKQVSAERDALKAENDKLKSDLDTLGKKTSTQKKNADVALAKTRDDNAQLMQHLQELETQLSQLTAEKKNLETVVLDRSTRLDQCSVKNAKLYELNSDLLHRYADKGMVDSLFQREPFTGLKQVQMENLMQDLQDKLDEQHVTDAPPPAETSNASARVAASPQ